MSIIFDMKHWEQTWHKRL